MFVYLFLKLKKANSPLFMICPLSIRQVKYLKQGAAEDHNISCGRFFYAHHFSLYFLIRLFSGIVYSFGFFDDKASDLTSNGVLQ